LFNEGKLSSSEERSLQEFWSQFNVDETACKNSRVLGCKGEKKKEEKGKLFRLIFLGKMKKMWKRLRTTS